MVSKKRSRRQSKKRSKKTSKKQVHQFVCTGNTCRSAALQAIARSIYPEMKFESCGTALRHGKKGEIMTPVMAKTIKLNNLPKAYKESKAHRSRSCTCSNLMKVSLTKGSLFVVADKNIKELNKLIKKCKIKNPQFKAPQVQKLDKNDIFDGYEDSCELWERKKIKCDKTKTLKEKRSYQKSFNQLVSALKTNKTFKTQKSKK